MTHSVQTVLSLKRDRWARRDPSALLRKRQLQSQWIGNESIRWKSLINFFLSSCHVRYRIRESSRWNLSQGRTHPWLWTRSLCMDKAILGPPPCLCSLDMEGIPCRDNPNKGGLGPCSLKWAKVATSLVWVEWEAWVTPVPIWWDPGWWVPTSPWGSSCNRDCRDSRYKSDLTMLYMVHSQWKNYKMKCTY